MLLICCICTAATLSLGIWIGRSANRDQVNENILDLAVQRSKKGDTQSLVFLGLRAMLASAVTKSNDPRGHELRQQARDYILKASAREDNAALWILVRNVGFAAPDEQYREAGHLIRVVGESVAEDPVAASILDFVEKQDEDTFRDAVGLELLEARKLLESKARNGARGRPVASLRLASYLYSADNVKNASEIHHLVADAIATLEAQGRSWNPFAYEYLADLFQNGYREVLPADASRAAKYKTLAAQLFGVSQIDKHLPPYETTPVLSKPPGG